MKLVVLDVSRFDPAALRPWSSDEDCLALTINPITDDTWSAPQQQVMPFDSIAQRHLNLCEPLFRAGTTGDGPRLPAAEVSFMAAADFALYVESRYHLALLLDLERSCQRRSVERVELVTDQADGGKYCETVRAYAAQRGLPFRRHRLPGPRRGLARSLARSIDDVAGRLPGHAPAYVEYLRSVVRRRLSGVKSPDTHVSGSRQTENRIDDRLRVAMLVYHPKSWRYLLPIRQQLLEAGHDVLLISPRLESDEVLQRAGVEYVSLRPAFPQARFAGIVEAYLSRLTWDCQDEELKPLVAPGGAFRDVIIRRAPVAVELYATVAPRIADLLRRQRTNVVVGTDSGSVTGRCFYRTAARLGIETVFVQHGATNAGVGVREYMLNSHRLLWGATSAENLIRSDVERPERIVCLGSPFHEERFGTPTRTPSPVNGSSAPIVLVTFGVPGGLVTEGDFHRAASEVFDAASRLPQVRFLVKPHPGDPGRMWSQLQASFGLSNVEVCRESDTYDLMRGCTVLATMYSTTGAEAIWLGKPVISIGLDGVDNGLDYLAAGAAYRVRDAGGLAPLLSELFASPPGADRLAGARAAFAEAFLHREERPAAARTVEFLENLVRRRTPQPAR